MRLDGKVAMVTGTSPNIGAGIAGGLAEEGAKVVGVDVIADNARECAACRGELEIGRCEPRRTNAANLDAIHVEGGRHGHGTRISGAG